MRDTKLSRAKFTKIDEGEKINMKVAVGRENSKIITQNAKGNIISRQNCPRK